LKIGYEPILGDMSLKRKVAVMFGYAYRKVANEATAISAFRSTGIWPVNRYAFQDDHFFPSVANTSGAAFVQPGQGQSQNEARTSQASSQRTRNGNTYLLVPVEKISPLSKAHIACSTKKNTGRKCLRRRQN